MNSNHMEVNISWINFSLTRRVTFPYNRLQYFVSCSSFSDVWTAKNVSKTKDYTALQSHVWISMYLYNLNFMDFFNKTIKRQIKIITEIITKVTF